MAPATATARTRFSGSLRDMGLADLVQTLAINPKGGVIRLRTDLGDGELWVAGGVIVDAHLGDGPDEGVATEPLAGEEAVYRFLMASRGTFAVELGRPADEHRRLSLHPQHAIMEGLRRVDEWGQGAPGIPAPATVLAVDARHVAAWSDDLDATERDVLEDFDAERPLVVLAAGRGDRDAWLRRVAAAVSRGLLRPVTELEAETSTSVGLVGIHGFWSQAYANHLQPPRHPLRAPLEIIATVLLLAGLVAAAVLASAPVLAGTLLLAFGLLWLGTALERERTRGIGPVAVLLAPVLTLVRIAEAVGVHVAFARRARAALALANS
jgi:hypothetical protein